MIRRCVATEWATATEKSPPPGGGGYERGSLVTGTTFMFLFIVADIVTDIVLTGMIFEIPFRG